MKIKWRKKSYKTLNLPPGTITYKGKKLSQVTTFEVIRYDKDTYSRHHLKNIDDVLNLKESDAISWININGLNNLNDIEQIGTRYNIHPLAQEDIVNTMHRPKIDEYDDYLFVIFKMLYFTEDILNYEQVSMVVGQNYVLTFQESNDDIFDDLRDRISTSKGRIRGQGSDYLMYAILDAVVDHYFTVIEAFGDKIEDLESQIFEDDSDGKETPGLIQALKHEILKIRRSIFPFREVVNRLEKMDCEIIDPKTHSYLRDLYDHIVQVSESVDLYREMVWNLMDMHMTIISNKMNEVMKVLTVIATIFIPLTFLAGIYGMNFDNMPELHYKYSYFVIWGIMVVIFIFMLLYFRRKKWF